MGPPAALLLLYRFGGCLGQGMGQGDSLYSHTSKAVLFSESLGERERERFYANGDSRKKEDCPDNKVDYILLAQCMWSAAMWGTCGCGELGVGAHLSLVHTLSHLYSHGLL